MTNNLYTADIAKRRQIIYKISVSAVFLALALAVKMFTTFYVPLLGAAGIKVSFAGIFTAFPALLFGPLYGGAVGALSDVLGYLLQPTGAYMPQLTATAFLSGFLTGLAWMAVTRYSKKGLRALISAAAVFFVLLGAFGLSVQISLNADGVMRGITVSAEALPSRGALEKAELSPLSAFSRSLAVYSKDTVTLTSLDTGGGSAAVPKAYEIEGYEYKVTSLAAGAVPAGVDKVYIPDTVKTIDAEAFAGMDSVTVYAPAGSYAASYAADNGIAYIECADAETFAAETGAGQTEARGYLATDNYRKNLAGYINFITLGFELIAIGALAVLAAGRIAARRASAEGEERADYARILFAVFLPRFLVTTINTEILRQALTAWSGRSFWILFVPRAAEEILSGVVQAYLITLLYAVYLSRLKKPAHSASKL